MITEEFFEVHHAVFELYPPKHGCLSYNASAMGGPRSAFEAVFDQVLCNHREFYRDGDNFIRSENILLM